MREALLALLEDGPHEAAQLAAWLDTRRITVARELKAMQRDGLARTVGTDKRWVLAGYTATTGRPPVLDREAIARAVLAALPVGQTRSTAHLRAELRVSRQAILQACQTHEQAGTLVQVGIGRVARWHHPDGRARTVVGASVIDVGPESDTWEDRGWPAADGDADADGHDVADLPALPSPRPVRIRPTKPGLRQTEARSSPTTGPAWWVGLTREQLHDAVEARQDEMHHSKMALRVDHGTREI